MVYNGHSNHWQFALTDASAPVKWLLLTSDVDSLNNKDMYFIGLSMTCYTSQFPKPSAGGTLDERLFLRQDGGAIATWGPTGLTVVHGHDHLQKGFLKRLWSQPPMTQHLGQLTEAGYMDLLTTPGTAANLDSLMTFLLLGDPLTKARVNANAAVYLPLIAR